MRRLLCLIVLLTGCGPGTPPLPPDRAGATDARLHEIGVLDSERAFRRAVSGQTFTADGYLMHFSPDGSWTARREGFVFAGSWTYRRGLLCQAYNLEVEKSPNRRCYRAAIQGDELLLVPMYEHDRIATW